jgi:serine/threonine-protein kinase RsbW
MMGPGGPPHMERSFERNFRALGDVFEFTRRFAHDHDFEESLMYPVNLIVEELFTNMVKYNTGGGQPIRVLLDAEDRRVRIELIDEDVDPWDPAQVPEVQLDRLVEQRKPGGLGLYLVRAIADKIEYDYKDRRMRVTVIKRLEH